MFSSLPLFIGLRYLASKRGSGFLSFISVFATGGMALGVFALIVVMSVMNGFDHELKQRLLRAIPHASVTASGGLDNWSDLAARLGERPNIVAASPYVGGYALLRRGAQIQGFELHGIDPDYDRDVSPVANYLAQGRLDELKPGEFGIVLGSLLAVMVGARVGDEVFVTLPKVSVTLAGVFPRTRRFTVIGIFEVGAQVDQSLGLIHLADAQRLFQRGDQVDGLRVRYTDLYQAPADREHLSQSLGATYEVVDWSQTQGSLFKAVKMEKTVTGLLLGIVIAVAAFNIITSLIMMVTEKRSDVAVLRTMGMRASQVRWIFITQGSATGIFGIVIGLLFGVPCALFLPEIVALLERGFGLHIFDPDVYYVTRLPSRWLFSDTLLICACAALLSLLATLYPAHRAARIEPAEAMRYDN